VNITDAPLGCGEGMSGHCGGVGPPETERDTTSSVRAGDMGAPTTHGSVAPTDHTEKMEK
jgi:hypothetical protein